MNTNCNIKTEKEIMSMWDMSLDKPKVSIICYVYNHEKYIKTALDGFIMQETNFPFEIIIHDDFSLDGSVNIIKQYENRFPNIIKPIYEKENHYSKHDGSINRIVSSKIRGKYVAICEGDDYWIDKDKLQKQVDYLENHKECSLILSNCYEENQNNERTICNPFPKSGIISNSELIKEKGKLPPTCSMMYRFDQISMMPSFFSDAPIGDRPKRLFLITIGYVYYMEDIMCVYRKDIPGSFSDRVSSNKEYAISVYNKMIDFYDRYDEYTNHKYHSEIECIKEKEEYFLYIRIKDKKQFLRCNYFVKNFKLLDRIIVCVSLYCPNSIKNIIKKTIRYGK